MTQELKPCPWCNSSNVSLIENIWENQVQCQNCGCQGKISAWQNEERTEQQSKGGDSLSPSLEENCDILGRVLGHINKAHDRDREKLQAQQSALTAARDALKFYADKEKYIKEWDKQFAAWISEIDSDDNGRRARSAIKQIDTLMQEKE